jgi:hypothetical protein
VSHVADHGGSEGRIDVDSRDRRWHHDGHSATNDAAATDYLHNFDDSRAHNDDDRPHKHNDNDNEHDNDDHNGGFHHLVRARHRDAATDDRPAETTRTHARTRR